MMRYDTAVSLLLLFSAATVVFSRRILIALVATSLFSMFLTLKYFILKAPDVAITEAALGAGLSTLVFLIGIRKTKERIRVIDLRDYITADCFMRIEAVKHEEILRTLTERCLAEYPASVRQTAYEEIADRRSFQEVDLGKGFALSHARIDELNDIHVCIGLLEKPVKYFRGPKVHTVLYVVLPDQKSRQYMSMMAKLARLLSDEKAEEAFASGDSERILEYVRQFEQS